MVKNIFIAFGILVSISLMFFISLSNGIRLGDFSYENVSVEGLYLKYDEKIIIDTQNVIIYNSNKTKSTQFKIKFSVENFFDQYFIHVENFFLRDPFLKVSGYIVLDPRTIDLETISELYFNQFSIQFSRNLKAVTAEKCFVQYEDNNFHFSFLNPIYGSVSLDESKVSINDFDHVMLNLQSKDRLNNEILELLSNYKVNVPVKQVEGTNEIKVNVKIPFDIKKDVDVHSNIDLKHGKILLYDIPLYVDSLKIQLDNSRLKGSGKLLKTTAGEEQLLYDITNKFEIDFKKDLVTGDFTVHEGSYESMFTTDTKGTFSLDFDKEFLADIYLSPNSFLMIKDELFSLKEFSTHYKNSTKSFMSHIKANHLNHDLYIELNDSFSLETLNSSGEFDLNFQDKETGASLEIKGAKYKSFLKDRFYLTLHGKQMDLKNEDTIIESQGFQGSFFEDKLHGTLYKSDIENKNFKLYLETLDILVNGKNDVQLSFPTIETSKIELPVDIHDVDIHIKNNKAIYSSIIDKKYSLHGELDLVLGDIKGVLDYQNELIDFNGNIFDKKTLNIPKLDLNYKEKPDDNFTVSIKKTKLLKHFFNYLIFKGNSSIYIEKNQKDNTTLVNMNKIDLNVAMIEEEKKDVAREKLFKGNINWLDSSFKIDAYTFPFKETNLKLSSGMIGGHMQLDESSGLNIKKDLHELIIASNNIESDYVNKVFEKNYFQDGNFEIFLTTKNVDTYEGLVKIHGVTFKELQFIDNLLLFVNSSPAFINPLLALPTFLRFTTGGFKVDGYHVVDGGFNFVYHKNKKILDINNIKTNGKINNFKGDISINLQDDTISGQLDVIFLKDFATVLRNIPLVDKITLNKDGNIAFPIAISGTIEKPSFTINNK